MRLVSIVLMAALAGAIGCASPASPPKEEPFKPGLGEIMGVIQQHHAKLYYAGEAGNWELAQYQLDEIQEGLEDAATFHAQFKSVKTPLNQLIPAMTRASLEQVSASIQSKDASGFKRGFGALTRSCNECHQAAEHGFIRIQIPVKGHEFFNQRFETGK